MKWCEAQVWRIGDVAIPNSVSPALRVAQGASYLYLAGILSNVLSLIYFAYATRILTIEEVGVVSALGMVSALFATVGTLAVPPAATKYVSELMGKEAFPAVRGVIRKVTRFGFILSLASSTLCLIASKSISRLVFGSLNYAFLVTVLALDLFAALWTAFFAGVLYGLQQFRAASMVNVVTEVLRTGFGLFLLYYGYGLLGLILGWVLGDFTRLALYLILTRASSVGEHEAFPIHNLLSFSLPLCVMGTVTYLLTYVDRYFILYYLGFVSLGIYAVAIAANGSVALIATSIGSSLYPQLSELHGRMGENALKEALSSASRYLAIVYLPFAFGLAATAYPTITLFAGAGYGTGALPLAILSLASALTYLSVVVNPLITSLGRTGVLLESSILAMVVDVALSIILIPNLGVVGAALGRAALNGAALLYCIYFLKRARLFRCNRGVFLKVSLAASLMGVVVLAVELIWMDRMLLPVYILAGAGVYVTMLRLLRVIDVPDMVLLRTFFPKELVWVVEALSKLLVKRG